VSCTPHTRQANLLSPLVPASPPLAHCASGASRSVTFTSYYLMRKERIACEAPLHRIRSVHPAAACPNDSIIAQSTALNASLAPGVLGGGGSRSGGEGGVRANTVAANDARYYYCSDARSFPSTSFRYCSDACTLQASVIARMPQSFPSPPPIMDSELLIQSDCSDTTSFPSPPPIIECYAHRPSALAVAGACV